MSQSPRVDTKSSRADTGAALALLLSAGSLFVVTCAGGQEQPQTPNVSSPVFAGVSNGGQTASASPVAASALPDALPVASQPAPEVAGAQPLAAFWAQIRQLTEHQRQDHVHVLWLGDSHTAADFWVQPVRKLLSEVAGFGGPGYLQIGLGVYRHGAARVESTGRWRTVPSAPSYFVGPQGDATFGLAGMRTVPKEGAEVTIKVYPSSLQGRVQWQVIYRLPNPGSRFRVRLEPGETIEVNNDLGAALDSGLRSFAIQAEPNALLHIDHAQGDPELFGVIAEGSQPGLVIDTLGINGARVATTLTWDEAHFIAQVRQRNPALVVLAYGTNEIGDALAPWRYAAQYEALLGRLRKAVPNVACLIVGPIDRALPDWSSNPRALEVEQVERQVASQQGCAFFSMIDAMGGPGSLQRWASASPALASKDHVHLTPQGYEALGDALGRSLLAGAHLPDGARR